MELVYDPYVGLGEMSFLTEREVIRHRLQKEFSTIEEGEGVTHGFVDIYENPNLKLYYTEALLLQAVEICSVISVQWKNIDLRRASIRNVVTRLSEENTNYAYSVVDFISLEFGVLVAKGSGLFKRIDEVAESVVVFSKGYYDHILSAYSQFYKMGKDSSIFDVMEPMKL